MMDEVESRIRDIFLEMYNLPGKREFLCDHAKEAKALFEKLKVAVEDLPLERQEEELFSARLLLREKLMKNLKRVRLPCIVCSETATISASCGHETCPNCQVKHGEECPLNQVI